MTTETVDPRYADIDRWPTILAVEAMLEGQMSAIAAVASQTGVIAEAADAAAERLRSGGRLIYAGAGTSGRIAVQDGVELYPTYGWPSERLAFLIAGGLEALADSAEGAEDDAEAARGEVAGAMINNNDVMIGVAASGRTPYTVAAAEEARAAGALTIGVANNPDVSLLKSTDYAVLLATGSEVVAGSTRMKGGTAQKAALNMLSTAIMIRLGLVYRGLMVNMRVSNVKLAARAHAIIADLANVSESQAKAALVAADGQIAEAVLIAMGHDATSLTAHGGDLRAAIEAARG